MIFQIPTDRINWTTSSFLIGTFFLTLTAVPLYLWYAPDMVEPEELPQILAPGMLTDRAQRPR